MTDTVIGSTADVGNPAGTPPAGDNGTPPTAAVPADWTATLDEGTRGFVQTKGWKSPVDVLGSYQNLEKLLGADKAGRAIVPPKDDAPAEEWAQFYGKLGRPETADGYKLPVPEGDPGEFAKTASGWFHELGLSQKQAEGLATKWNEMQGAMMEQHDAAFAQQAEVDAQELRKAWGDKFDANAELARRAIREAGLSAEDGQAIERALGVKKAAEVFAFLGRQFAEAPMKGGEGGRGSFGDTVESAKARITALRNDADWTAKLLNNNADAKAEWDRLHKIAYPDS